MKAPSQMKLDVLIKDGKFASNQELIRDLLEAYEGQTIEVRFKRKFNKRSNLQNNYYWGVIVAIFQNCMVDQWGELYSKEDIHEFLKYNCNYEEKLNEATGELIRIVKSTTENSTIDQKQFHTRCRNLCKEFFNTEIPPPQPGMQVKY